MHDALGNPLVIEVRYLFAEVESSSNFGSRMPVLSEF